MEHKTKNVKKIIFGRTIIIALSLLVQILFIYISTIYLGNNFTIVALIERIFAGIVILYIINKDIITEFKLTWIILIFIMPLFGAVFYTYTHLEFGSRRQKKEFNRNHYIYTSLFKEDDEVMRDLYKSSPSTYNLSRYIYNRCKYRIYNNTKVNYFSNILDAFNSMIENIRCAEKYVFLEYFIIDEGYMWNILRDELIKKSREGVEVRIMCDGINMLKILSQNKFYSLKKYGIKVKVFSPVRAIVSTVSNNRDHRKICIIDGKIGYTGGFNIADEYINKIKKFGIWKDSAISLSGMGTVSLLSMFLEMWNIGEKKIDNINNYIPSIDYEINDYGNGFVIPFADSPLDKEYLAMNVFCHMFNNAKRYINIMTPYLVLNSEVLTSLKNAAKRGVDVKIIMPGIPDKKYAFYLAKTYYDELIKSGINIYEFTQGFVHSKVVVCDDECAMVGTINLDYRSLFHHFECGIYLFRNMQLLQIKNDFNNMLSKSKCISILSNSTRKWYEKIIGYILKVFAPIM